MKVHTECVLDFLERKYAWWWLLKLCIHDELAMKQHKKKTDCPWGLSFPRYWSESIPQHKILWQGCNEGQTMWSHEMHWNALAKPIHQIENPMENPCPKTCSSKRLKTHPTTSSSLEILPSSWISKVLKADHNTSVKSRFRRGFFFVLQQRISSKKGIFPLQRRYLAEGFKFGGFAKSFRSATKSM